MTDTIARTPEDARQLGSNLHTLQVNPDWDEPWQQVVSELPTLKRLYVRYDSGQGPAAVTRWPEGLEELQLAFDHDPNDEIVPWIDALPDLKVVEIWGKHLNSGALPADIARWTQLETLKLVSCGLETLPAELAELRSLRCLHLRNLALTSLPLAVCALTGLEVLEIRTKLHTLPDELAKLENLHTLDLAGCLNDGTLSASDTKPSHLRPMPAVIGRLKALETLNLGMCGIYARDIEALAGHSKLRVLDLEYAGIRDLSPLQKLPALRELYMRTCYNIKDLGPLAGMQLEVLDVSRARMRDLSPLLELPHLRSLNIKSASRIRSLSPLFSHPTLETLEASEEVMENWAKGQALAGITDEAILAGLDSDDPEAVRQALKQLTLWVELNSTDDQNAVYALIGIEREDMRVEVPLLDKALKTAAPVPSELLGAIVYQTFQSMSDCLDITIKATEQLIERNDAAGQKTVVDAYLRAARYYDGGHRFWDDTVHDTFIDDLFPEFLSEPLSHLLAGLDDDCLNGEQGDCMDALFVPAFDNATEESFERTMKRLRTYAEENTEYLGAEYFGELLGKVAEASPAAAKVLQADLEESQRLAAWSAKLGDADPLQGLQSVLEAVASSELTVAQTVTLDSPIRKLLRDLPEASPELARAMVDLALKADERWWANDTVLRALTTDAAWLKADETRRKKAVMNLEYYLRQGHDDLEGLLCALTDETVTELRTRHAAKKLKDCLERSRGDLITAIEVFQKYPSELKISSYQSRTLAQRYEELWHYEKRAEIAQLSDALRELRPSVDWAPADQQYALSYPLVAAVAEGPEYFEAHVAPWLEGQELVEPRFAFNLACYHAKLGRKDALLKTAAAAVALGKPTEQFLEDSDFQPFVSDPEFREAIGA